MADITNSRYTPHKSITAATDTQFSHHLELSTCNDTSPLADRSTTADTSDGRLSVRSMIASIIVMCAVVAVLIMAYMPYTSLERKLPANTLAGHLNAIHSQSVDASVYDDLPLEFASFKNKITERIFDSGLRWVHIDRKDASSVQFTVSVGAGSFNEMTDSERRFPEGTAHLLEHSIFLNMTAEEKMKFNYWNAYTDKSETVYTLACSSDNIKICTELVARELFNFKQNPKSKEEVSAVDSE